MLRITTKQLGIVSPELPPNSRLGRADLGLTGMKGGHEDLKSACLFQECVAQ